MCETIMWVCLKILDEAWNGDTFFLGKDGSPNGIRFRYVNFGDVHIWYILWYEFHPHMNIYEEIFLYSNDMNDITLW